MSDKDKRWLRLLNELVDFGLTIWRAIRPRAIFKLYGIALVGGLSIIAGGPWPLDFIAWVSRNLPEDWSVEPYVPGGNAADFAPWLGTAIVMWALWLAYQTEKNRPSQGPDRTHEGRVRFAIDEDMTLHDLLVALGTSSGATIDFIKVSDDLLASPLQPGERQFADLEAAICQLPMLLAMPTARRLVVERDGEVYSVSEVTT